MGDAPPEPGQAADLVSPWRAAAADYGRLSARIGFYDASAERLADMVPPAARIVADFACGHGRFARALLRRAPVAASLRALILMDAAPEMLHGTRDIAAPGLRIHRLVGDHHLRHLAPAHVGRIDVIGVNSAIHLLRDRAYRLDLGPFLARCRDVLAPGGSVLANIPDQDFDFADGWTSRFHVHARRLRPDTPERAALERISGAWLRIQADRFGFDLSLETRTFELTWSDFIDFYRIPAIGGCRLGETGRIERLAEIETQPAWFEREPYRWAFVRLIRRDRLPGRSLGRED